MTPVRPQERIEAIDILRGVSILGVLLMNMLGYAGYGDSFAEMGTINRIAVLLLKFFVQAKFYTLLSFLFGWGMAIQMERAARRGTRFVSFYLRRLLILLLIGSVHAILIWDGDILVTYALLGVPLLLFRTRLDKRTRSEKMLLVAAAVCILIPVLISTPGPAETFREAYARGTAAYWPGSQADVYAAGTYLDVTLHRLKAVRYFYSQAAYWATHVFGMFLLGLYAGRRRIFRSISEHLSLFRQVMWWGLAVGIVCNLVFVSVSASPHPVPSSYYTLATRGARAVGGPALCLFYIAATILLVRRKACGDKQHPRELLAPLAAVGRMALSNYLLQSIVCTLIFYGYGLGLYGKLGPAITLLLSIVIYRLQMGLSNWWLGRYRFGPAEWLWRSLTYGKRQPITSRRRQGGRADEAPAERGGIALAQDVGGLAFVLRRLLFIAGVSFAIVYFCILGMRLRANSTTRGERVSAWDLVEPTVNETLDFFADAFHGDLGRVGRRSLTEYAWTPVMELLAHSYVKSARLLVLSITLAAILGVAAGGLAASWRHSSLALSTLTLTVIGVSIPSFFLALLFQVGAIEFYKRTGVRLVFFSSGLHQFRSLLPLVTFPMLVLAARPLAHIARVTFVSLSDVLRQDFVRTARAKGLRPLIVFWRHTLPNVGISILTAVVVSLRFALGSLPVVEVFFDWPGLGVTMLDAIYQQKIEVVAGAALSLGVTFLLINMSLDLIYRLIDPRLRAQSDGGGA